MSTLKSIIRKSIDARTSNAAIRSLLDKYEINYSELEVMFAIHEYTEVSPSYIAEYLCSERAKISRVLKSLENKSLIIYRNDNVDRRKVFVTLSKQGASMTKSINKALSNS